MVRSFRLVVTLTVSYLVVFLVPVVSMLLYYYPLTNRTMTQKETNWNQYSVDLVRQGLDGVWKSLYDLPGDLVANQDLYLSAAGSDWDRWRTTREFHKLVRSDRYVYNTFLYLQRDGFLYSADGSAGPAAGWLQAETGYFYPRWPREEILADLAHPRGILVRPAEDMVVPERNPQRMVTFLFPVPPNSNHPVGTAVVLVKEEALLDLIRPISERSSSDVWIADQDGRLIAGVSRGSRPLEAAPQEVTVSARSQVNSWTVNARLPQESLLAEVRQVQFTTVLVSFALFVVGGLVIVWAVWYHQKPVKLLAQFARASVPAEPGRNEWETIQGSLTTLKHATVHARQNLLGRLVAGDFPGLEDFHALSRPFGLTLDHPWLTTAVLTGLGDTLPEPLRGEYHQAEDRGDLWVLDDHSGQDRILVFCHRDPEFPRVVLGNFLERWFDLPGLTVAGLGTSVTQPWELRGSLAEARRVADALYFDQGARWAGPERPSASGSTLPAQTIQALEAAVRTDDVETVKRTSHALRAVIEASDLGPATTRALAHSVVGILRAGRTHHGLGSGDPGWRWGRVTRTELSTLVETETQALCQAMTTLRGDRVEAERRRLLAYLDALESDAQGLVSLREAAEAFGMSESGFSRHFKKLIGCSFKDFVDQKRIEVSKRLLVETEEPVEAIGQRLGFALSNSSSFIRSFKRRVGVTPGQYRLKHEGTRVPQEKRP